MSRTIKFRQPMNVRAAPSTKGKVVATYAKGDECAIDGVVLEDGRVWGRYIGAGSGLPRYVCLGTTSRVTVG